MAIVLALPFLAHPARAEDKNPEGQISFQVFRGESTSISFVVTEPGKITARATWKGPGLELRLWGPVDKPVTQSGKDGATIEYAVTPEDVKRGCVWTLEIHETAVAKKDGREGPERGGPKGVDLKASAKAVAEGSVDLAHPAGDLKKGASELKMAAERDDKQAKAAEEKLRKMVAERRKEEGAKREQVVRERIDAQKLKIKEALKPMNLTVEPPTMKEPEKPVMTTLGATSGQPGDQILVEGTGFFQTTEVWFIVAEGRHEKGSMEPWNATQMLVKPPDIAGVVAYDGFIYLKNRGVKSDLKAFRFEPTIDYVDFGVTNEMLGDVRCSFQTASGYPFIDAGDVVVKYNQRAYLGNRGDDHLLENVKLKNGWVLDKVEVTWLPGCDHTNQNPHGGASRADAREGTDSLWVKVHWWQYNSHALKYSVSWTIRGPKGVPYR